MPYLDKQTKQNLDSDLLLMSEPGHLTYKLYKTCLWYIKLKGKRFSVLCEVMGALLCTILELYRRIIASYEDEKIKSNGDVQ